MLFLLSFSAVSLILTAVTAFFGKFSGTELFLCIPVFVGYFLVLFVIMIIVLLIWSLCIGKYSEIKGNRPAYRFFVYEVLKFAYKAVGVKTVVNGSENLPDSGNFVVVCNHASDLDPTFILLALGKERPAGFIGKKDIWEWFFVPNAMRGLGCLPIDRENDRNAAKTIIESAKMLKENKLSIGVFPEGYCEKESKLLPFRNGVFKIAQRAEKPIVITALHGTNRIFKNLFKKNNIITLDILETVDSEKVCSMRTSELGDYIHSVMEKALAADEV